MYRKKREMLPVEEVDISGIKYTPQHIQGFKCLLDLFHRHGRFLDDDYVICRLKERDITNLDIACFVKQMLRNTVIPERPMFRPEFPPQGALVAERIISAVDEFNGKKPPVPLLISFNADEVRKQAAASTARFNAGDTNAYIFLE
ncbi:hypothetical protein BHM03_00044643 [Ensete ventricosum]|nr:hypothetical protein BHM03_00044643 [Ensete ventricosum]